MTAMITDQVIPEASNAADTAADAAGGRPAEAESESGRLHRGPVARLLARVSRMSGEYADYQMEAGVWRKLAI